MTKIDWPNHLVGFFSALFGILIAFELDEWKENRKERKIAESAFVQMQQEIDINRNMLQAMVNTNLKMIAALREQALQDVDSRLIFRGTLEQAQAINANANLSNIAYIRLPEEPYQPKVGAELHVMFSRLIHPVMHNSAWESAKTTGALNNMSYEKVLSLSSLYNPTRIMDELQEIRNHLRSADEIHTKADLEELLGELEVACHIIENELSSFESFAAMLNQME